MLGHRAVGHAIEMIHGVGFMVLGEITRLRGCQPIVFRQRFKKIQTGFTEGMFP